MCKFSIVVPVYNTELYLHRCLDSIVNQSFSDFEVLLIDDGSTDGSGKICDFYAEKDSRVRVFHKENGGVSSARNLGLDNAQGDWAAFVDSDDILPNRALECMMVETNKETDMVYGGIRKFAGTDETVEIIDVKKKEAITIDEALNAFVVPKKRNGDWHRYLFNRIYRMDIIKKFGLRFFTNIYYKEDGLFVVQYLCRCQNKVLCVPDIVYLYRQVSNSAMGSLTTSYNERLLTNVDAHGYIIKEFKKRGVCKDLIEREVNEVFGNYDWISSIMRRSGAYNKKSRHLLLKKTIKNAGIVNFIRHFVIFRCGRKIKRKLSL